jgi:Mg2+ and Co2+ transporter CorA
LLRGIFEHGFSAVTDDDFSTHFRDEYEAVEMTLKDERLKLKRVVDAIENAPESTSLILRLRELELSVVKMEARLAERREWIAELAASEDGSQIEGSVIDALTRLDGDEHIDYRAGLHDRITRVITRIDVHSKSSSALIHWKNGTAETSVRLGPPKSKSTSDVSV